MQAKAQLRIFEGIVLTRMLLTTVLQIVYTNMFISKVIFNSSKDPDDTV